MRAQARSCSTAASGGVVTSSPCTRGLRIRLLCSNCDYSLLTCVDDCTCAAELRSCSHVHIPKVMIDITNSTIDCATTFDFARCLIYYRYSNINIVQKRSMDHPGGESPTIDSSGAGGGTRVTSAQEIQKRFVSISLVWHPRKGPLSIQASHWAYSRLRIMAVKT